jgi:diadenosine tetraphosphate (Ap4A) HIT family hydrolase
MVEHAYPIKIMGWLVIVLKRHAMALDELSPAEFEELAFLLPRVIKILKEELNCEKEYVSCYAEKKHFQHVHFHIFAKPPDLPEGSRGAKSFTYINVAEEEALPKEEIAAFCTQLKEKMMKMMS